MDTCTCTCPEHGRWYSAADIDPLVRRIDVALHGEDGAARQALLIDVVPHITHAANMHGPLLAALSAQPSPGGQDALAVIEELAELNRACAALDPDYKGPTEAAVQTALAALAARQPVGDQCPDDLAVDAFAAAMKAKMAAARAKGRGGWEDPAQCTAEDLSRMLRNHVEKGDPRDVANFCMMLHQRGEAIAARQPVGEPVAWGVRIGDSDAWGYVEVESDADFIGKKSGLTYEKKPLYAAPPAQAVDLSAVRYALDAAEGLAVACASVDGFSREELASAGREMRTQFSDARALIDSKEEGRYRLCGPGDVLEPDDEFLLSDATWKRIGDMGHHQLVMGAPYNPHMSAARRKVAQ